MRVSRAVHIGAVIGTAGGALRVASSFAPILIASDNVRTWLYVIVDICLASGLFSLYLRRRQAMPATGTLGAFIAIGGLIAGRVIPLITDRDFYPMSAASVVIGVLMLSLSEWHMQRILVWIPATFALSMVVGGIAMFVAGADALVILSGILFGSAFAGMAIGGSPDGLPPTLTHGSIGITSSGHPPDARTSAETDRSRAPVLR